MHRHYTMRRFNVIVFFVALVVIAGIFLLALSQVASADGGMTSYVRPSLFYDSILSVGLTPITFIVALLGIGDDKTTPMLALIIAVIVYAVLAERIVALIRRKMRA